MITLNICLSDIPEEKIKISKNGKKYVDLVVTKRKEPGSQKETHTIFCSQTAEQRKEKLDKIYCGSGTEIIFENK